MKFTIEITSTVLTQILQVTMGTLHIPFFLIYQDYEKDDEKGTIVFENVSENVSDHEH